MITTQKYGKDVSFIGTSDRKITFENDFIVICIC